MQVRYAGCLAQPLTCSLPKPCVLAVGRYLVVKEKEATEEAVEVGREQREINRGGAGPLHHHRHEAVQTEHEGAETHVEKTCTHTQAANHFTPLLSGTASDHL